VNPRAAAIAELVLWIGYLQWHFRTKGGPPDEPILRAFKNIQVKNAVLTWDGEPVPQILNGQEIYPNARVPDWPTAEFIVGNPPFIGNKRMREVLGHAYVDALWKAHSRMNESADFVMCWWERAADILTRKNTALRSFGLVTTNSVSQVFQRRVMERHLKAKRPLSITMAIPDHPWTKATKDAAAVRIAMMVVEAGDKEGKLTGLYNVLEKLRAGARPSDLDDVERRIFDDGLVLIMKELHDKIDVAVAGAYSWPADLSSDEILSRLVALNKERSEEERRGLVRWLRPDYQVSRFAKGIDKQAAEEEGAQVAAELIGSVEQKPSFPTGAVEQTAAIFAALAAATEALDAGGLAAQFKRTKATEKRVGEVLASLARLGYVTSVDGKSFTLRKAA
jgi:hypothetical protein